MPGTRSAANSPHTSRRAAVVVFIFAALLLPCALGSFRQGAIAATLVVLLWACGLFGRPGRIWQRLLLICGGLWALGEMLTLALPATEHRTVSLVLLVVWPLLAAALWAALRQSSSSLTAPRGPRLALLLILGITIVAQGANLAGWEDAALHGNLLAREQLLHPTRTAPSAAFRQARRLNSSLGSALLKIGLQIGDCRESPAWMARARQVLPFAAMGKDTFADAVVETPQLSGNPLARMILLGGDLRLRMPNRCVSLDYNPRRDELAVLRDRGELLLISAQGRRLHVFTGDLGKAARVRATPDGAGYLCLFDRGETRYFGADSPYACTGEVKYGLGRAVDFVFGKDKSPRVLNAVGAIYRIGSGTRFTQLVPPLFPGVDEARGLAQRGATTYVLNCHGGLVRLDANFRPSPPLRFPHHRFPPPNDDAIMLRPVGKDLFWLDAWGALHAIAAGGSYAYGDLGPRSRRGECVDFVAIPCADRVLALDAYGEIFAYELSRFGTHPNREAPLP